MERFKSLPRMAQIGLAVAIALVGFCCGAAALGAVLPDSDTAPTQAVLEPSPTTEGAAILPTATPIPPTHTPLPKETDTPEATPTASPSNTPPPTPTQSPTNTPAPTSTTAPTDTPTPTQVPTDTPVPTPARTEAHVVRVIDGDTIEVMVDGQNYPLRYIGIDTPEQNEPYAEEATAANRNLVGGQTVYLEQDESETDQYDRLLRYVYLADGTFVNAELVRLGYATAKEYPPDTRHHRQLSQLQNEAQRALRGLWKATPTLVDRTLPTPIPTAHIKATPACIVAGELLYWFGEDQCCAGLSAIYITHPCDSPGDGGCKADGCFVMPPGACSVCAPCGDGVCQPEYRENPCSCAADCK